MTDYTNAGTTSAYDVADAFLLGIGATPTPALRRAVAIWLKQESGSTVRGNNPWNLHHGAACGSQSGFCASPEPSFFGYLGNRFAGPSDKNVAVFSDIKGGAAANAANLKRLANSGYGYDKVISEAQAGDAYGFLLALQNSSWSAGHYGHNKLTNAYTSGGGSNFQIKLLQPTGSGSVQMPDTSTGMLGAWGDLVSFPVGHVLTASDVDSIMNILSANGFFSGDSLFGGSATEVRRILNTHIGDTWGKPLQDQLQSEFGAAAVAATDPITKVGTQIADTITWIGFILLGIVFIFGGIYLLRPTEGSA